MICARIGVAANLSEYGHARITDAYLIGELLILRTTARPFEWDQAGGTRTIVVHRIHHWFDEHRDYGVMIVLAGDWEGDLDSNSDV